MFTTHLRTSLDAAPFLPPGKPVGGVQEPGNLETAANAGGIIKTPLSFQDSCLETRISLAEDKHVSERTESEAIKQATLDIAEVPAVEVIVEVAVNLMSAAAIKCGLADEPGEPSQMDLDEARKLINALAGLVTAAAPDISDSHARPLRDGLRSVQLAFREASSHPDPIGKGPGEKYTGPVN